MEEENKEKELRTIVVQELPAEPVSQAKLSNGETVNLVSISDALTQILAKVTKIEKSVG